MPVTKSLFGQSRTIPVSKERNWGAEVTAWIGDINDAVDQTHSLDGSVARARYSVTDTALAAGATLTPTHNVHRVSGSGGAVTLDGTTAFAVGTRSEQVLVLRGTDNTNTVTVPATSNVEMNGPVTLGDGNEICFLWDDTDSKWKESSRNN